MTERTDLLYQVPGDPEERRRLAIRRLQEKSDFRVHLTVYILINAMLVAIWALVSRGLFFWPVFPIAGWGVGLLIHGYTVYRSRVITEEQIQRELQHLTR